MAASGAIVRVAAASDDEVAQFYDPAAHVYFRTEKNLGDDGEHAISRAYLETHDLDEEIVSTTDEAIRVLCELLDNAGAEAKAVGKTTLFSENQIRDLALDRQRSSTSDIWKLLGWSLTSSLEVMVGSGYLRHLHRGFRPDFRVLQFDTSCMHVHDEESANSLDEIHKSMGFELNKVLLKHQMGKDFPVERV